MIEKLFKIEAANRRSLRGLAGLQRVESQAEIVRGTTRRFVDPKWGLINGQSGVCVEKNARFRLSASVCAKKMVSRN